MRLEERQGWRLGGVCECNRGFGWVWVEEEEVKELMMSDRGASELRARRKPAELTRAKMGQRGDAI